MLSGDVLATVEKLITFHPEFTNNNLPWNGWAISSRKALRDKEIYVLSLSAAINRENLGVRAGTLILKT